MLFPFKILRRLVTAFVLAVVVVFLGTAAQIWWVARQDQHPQADALVVLGASQFDGRPSAVFKARLDHAIVLWKEGVAPRVVTLGASRPGDRFTEAEAGATYLREHGVTSVVPVSVGHDTLESLKGLSAECSRRGWRRVVLVTDPWHSLRSRRMARDLGLTAHTSPTRHGPAVHARGTEVRYIARETVAYLFYRIFHRSSEAGPPAV